MSNAPVKTPIEVTSLPEISRRSGVSASSVRRRLERAGFVPDFELIEGERRTPLILAARLPQLQNIIERNIL
jgi:hypothetical protein